MKIEEIINTNKIPHYVSDVCINIKKIFNYLKKTKDEDFIPDFLIQKVELHGEGFMKLHIDNKLITIDLDRIGWLKTHHFLTMLILYKKECEFLWDLIKDHIDIFVVEDWFVKDVFSGKNSDIISYDREFIYVNEKNTNIVFNYENYSFVYENFKKWL